MPSVLPYRGPFSAREARPSIRSASARGGLGLARHPAQPDHGRTPSASLGRGIRERADLGQPPEERPDPLALEADASTVDQADLLEPGCGRLLEVRLDDGDHVAGTKGVQVEVVFEGQNDLAERRVRGILLVGLAIRQGLTSPSAGSVVSTFVNW